jgi:putative dimethyl sulfoxide reductase chaperone
MKNTDINCVFQRAAWFQVCAQGFAHPQQQNITNFYANLAKLTIPECYSIQQQQEIIKSKTKTLRAWKQVRVSELESKYIALFLANAVCPLNETAYGDGRSSLGRPSILADINGFYTAFGMEINAKSPKLPDHLTVELEFYSILLLKLAYAKTQFLSEQKQITQDAVESFLNEHLGCWITAFVTTLGQHTNIEAWLCLADLLESLVNSEIQLLKIKPTKMLAKITNDVMQEESLVCEYHQ